MKTTNDQSEKYLSISILGDVKVNAFRNERKTKPTDPDFRGDGVAVWINTRREKENPNIIPFGI